MWLSSLSQSRRTVLLCVVLGLAVLAAYANHFYNDLHFDDLDAVRNNPAIRDLHNIPRFFVDPTLFSRAENQYLYRPITSVSLAVDYWLGDGSLFYFHLSTFLWYLVQLLLMFFLFRRIMDLADPHPSNIWTALLATMCYGLHPANAETVNYVIQRADLYNTLGTIACLWLFVRYPGQRKFGWYLLPAVAAILAKPPALIFPLMLLIYVFLFERQGKGTRKWVGAIRTVAPALLVVGALAWLLAQMRSPTWSPKADSPFPYWVTQPFVALHYFKSFFLPTELAVHAGWPYLGLFSLKAVAGYLFVLLMLGGAYLTARRPDTRPIAFGILWFFVALLPTSLMALREVTNDHRMFFPFVGLTLSVFWACRLALFRKTARLTSGRRWQYAALSAVVLILLAGAVGTRQRNRVWFTDEGLWRDSTRKNPNAPDGWINLGDVFLRQGDYEAALPYYQRAIAVRPLYSTAEMGLARIYVGLHRDAEVEEHLRRTLISLHGAEAAVIYVVLANWLESKGRPDDSIHALESAQQADPRAVEVRHAFLTAYSKRQDWPALERVARETLRLKPDDELAASCLSASLDSQGRKTSGPPVDAAGHR